MCVFLRKIVFVFALVLLSLNSTQAQKFSKQPKWDKNFPSEKVYKALKNAKIKDMEMFSDYLRRHGHSGDLKGRKNHTIHMAHLKCGLKVIWKICTEIQAQAEVAAYKAALALGENFVPPAVPFKYGGDQGVLSFYVNPHHSSKKEVGRKRGKLCSKDLEARVRAFHRVFNWDCHNGNILYQKNKGKFYPALIDNAGLHKPFLFGPGNHPFLYIGTYSSNNNRLLEIKKGFQQRHVKRYTKSAAKHAFRHCSVRSGFFDKVTTGKSNRSFFAIKNNTAWERKAKRAPLPKKLSKQTIRAYKKLDKKKLERIWASLLKRHPAPKVIVHLTLIRIKKLLDECSVS